MEKITKEELMKKLNLTEEELEKIAGGSDFCANFEYNKEHDPTYCSAIEHWIECLFC